MRLKFMQMCCPESGLKWIRVGINKIKEAECYRRLWFSRPHEFKKIEQYIHWPGRDFGDYAWGAILIRCQRCSKMFLVGDGNLAIKVESIPTQEEFELIYQNRINASHLSEAIRGTTAYLRATGGK